MPPSKVTGQNAETTADKASRDRKERRGMGDSIFKLGSAPGPERRREDDGS